MAKGEWKLVVLPEGKDDVFKSKITEKDTVELGTYSEKVGTFFKKSQKEKKLLYIGIGVGNPEITLSGNPSVVKFGSSNEKILQRQEKPGFLDDALKKDSAVAVLLFNSCKGMQCTETNNMIVLQFPFCFPLENIDNNAKNAFTLLSELKEKASVFVCMNSVSQNNYPNMLSLFRHKAHLYISAYLKSYAETGAEETYYSENPKADKVWEYTCNNEIPFSSLDLIFKDVFDN
jgi:hypothetical protein